jgi:hypothetical protein
MAGCAPERAWWQRRNVCPVGIWTPVAHPPWDWKKMILCYLETDTCLKITTFAIFGLIMKYIFNVVFVYLRFLIVQERSHNANSSSRDNSKSIRNTGVTWRDVTCECCFCKMLFQHNERWWATDWVVGFRLLQGLKFCLVQSGCKV